MVGWWWPTTLVPRGPTCWPTASAGWPSAPPRLSMCWWSVTAGSASRALAAQPAKRVRPEWGPLIGCCATCRARATAPFARSRLSGRIGGRGSASRFTRCNCNSQFGPPLCSRWAGPLPTPRALSTRSRTRRWWRDCSPPPAVRCSCSTARTCCRASPAARACAAGSSSTTRHDCSSRWPTRGAPTGAQTRAGSAGTGARCGPPPHRSLRLSWSGACASCPT
mmetsp:Transcript_11375/g.37645  ORF Transcript_11375/g.37645 Transcript_11375/m.37645 type:complete len:222 (-) Transcript_11375:93-758(-)